MIAAWYLASLLGGVGSFFVDGNARFLHGHLLCLILAKLNESQERKK